jgi:uncharacterized protein (TIRG00374 family)
MSVPHVTDRHLKALLVSVLVASGGYLAAALWSGWEEVIGGVSQVGAAGILAALAMSLANYGLRFARWQMYLAALGCRVPLLASARIYLAGFALTTTPAKAGEAIRSIFLKRWGVGYATSVAAFVSERLSDLVAVVLLTFLGLTLYPAARPLVVFGAAVVLLLLVLLSQERAMKRWRERMRDGEGRIRHLLHHFLRALLEARRCHTLQLVLVATILSVTAWSAEAVALHWIVQWLGSGLPLAFTVFVYAVSMLAGALSFLPGGLGGTEAVMIGLLMWKGVPAPQAVTATVLIRLATLWFAVGLGLIALGTWRQEARPV